jgi:hypothetical protein
MTGDQPTTQKPATLIARHWTPEPRPRDQEPSGDPDQDQGQDRRRSSWETGDTHP